MFKVWVSAPLKRPIPAEVIEHLWRVVAMGSFQEDVNTALGTRPDAKMINFDITKSVVYRAAQTIYNEVSDWRVNPDRYSDALQQLHQDVIGSLELVIDEHPTVIKVSFTLPVVKGELSHGVETDI